MVGPLSLPPPTAPQGLVRAPWGARLLQLATTYLPMLLMGLLALGTWWLVKSTPVAEGEAQLAPPRHVPDYTMNNFTVQRFGPDGAMRVQIEGDQLRHYPDTDTLEIDNARIRAISPDGRVTVASARRALANADASEVQLTGGATVLREAKDKDEAIEFRGEFLHAMQNTEQLRSHLPVTVLRGRSQVVADAMEYDNLTRVLQFKGRIRAVFTPPGAAASGPGTGIARTGVAP
jgi:lipopolysaccharide export system protein LptC